MLFVEFRFVLFFLVLFSVCWSLRGNEARKLWLLACSYTFYAAWDWRFCFLIAFSTAVDFYVGRRLERSADETVRRRWLLLSLGINLGLLGFFKYCNFFFDSAATLLGVLGLPASNRSTLQIILPVGISFFTFQSLSYTIDVHRRRLRAVRDFPDLALAVSFFPQLVAGPITRAADFLPQLARSRRFDLDVNVRACLTLFLVGFFKKACVSDNVAPLVDRFFAAPAASDLVGAWLGVGFYAVQIYCDFSGYTDMAIATAGLLGYRLAHNFSFPYFAGDLAEFWRRWHMSLSSWLRDYLYIPLGGNRGGEFLVARNLLLTMLLGGLWHGAAWHFVLWGGLHGVGLVVHRAWSRVVTRGGVPLQWARWVALCGLPLTFLWVCCCWVFFRAPDLPTALAALRACVPFVGQVHSPALTTPAPLFWLNVFLLLALLHWLTLHRVGARFGAIAPPWAFAAGCGLAVGAMLWLVPPHYAPFIYFQF